MDRDIGDVHVDVYADASPFFDDLRKQFDKHGPALAKQFSDAFSDSLDSSLKSSVDSTLKTLRREMTAWASEISNDPRYSPTLSATLEIDTTVATSDLADFKNDQSFDDLELLVTVNTDLIRLQMLALRAELAVPLTTSAVSLGNSFGLQFGSQAANAVGSALANGASSVVSGVSSLAGSIGSSLTSMLGKGGPIGLAIGGVLAGLAVQVGSFVGIWGPVFEEVSAEITKVSGLGLSFDVVNQLVDLYKNVDRLTPIVALATAAIGALGGAVWYLAGGLINVLRDLGNIVPIALLLPGLVVGLGSAFFILSTALGQAADFAPALTDRLSALKTEIGELFWMTDVGGGTLGDVLFGDLTRLLDAAMPTVTRLTEAVSRMFYGLLDGFQSVGDANLIGFFDSVASMVERLGPAATSLGSALGKLIVFAGPYLEQFGTWIAELAGRFDTWVTSIIETGEATRWVETAVNNLKELGDALFTSFEIFNLFADAAQTHTGGLRGLNDALTWLRDIVADPDMQSALGTLFRSGEQAMDQFLPALEAGIDLFTSFADTFAYLNVEGSRALGDLLTGVFNALNTPIVSDGIRALIDGINEGVQGILPYLPTLAEGLGGVFSVFGTAAANILPVVASALNALSGITMGSLGPLIEGFAGAAQAVIDFLAPFLTDAFEAISPVVAMLGLLGEAVQLFMAGDSVGGQRILDYFVHEFPLAVETAITTLISIFSTVMETLAPVISALIQAIADTFVALAPVLMDAGLDLLKAFLQVFKDNPDLLPAITSFLNSIILLFTAHSLMFLAAGAALLITIVTGIIQNIGVIAETVVDVVNAMITSFRENGPEVTSAMDSIMVAVMALLELFLPLFLKMAMDFILQMIDGLWTMRGRFIDKIWGLVNDGIAELSKIDWLGIGANMIAGLVQGIADNAGDIAAELMSAVGDGVNQVLDFLGINSPSRLFAGIGSGVMEGYIKGIERMRDAANESLLTSIPVPDVNQLISPTGAPIAPTDRSLYGPGTASESVSPNSSSTSIVIEPGAIVVDGGEHGSSEEIAQEVVNRIAEKVGI